MNYHEPRRPVRRGTFTHENQGIEPSVDEDKNNPESPKLYEIAIPTRNLKWTNLAKYLELEFMEFKKRGVQIPKDQKTVTVLNEHFVVHLPARLLTPEQKQDIDLLRGSSQAEIEEFLRELQAEKENPETNPAEPESLESITEGEESRW